MTSLRPIPATVLAPQVEGQTISFLYLIRLIVGRIRLIGALGLAAAVAGAGGSFLFPNLYTANAVIVPPQQPQSAALAMIGQSAATAALGTRDLGLRNPADIYIGILKGRTIADSLIKRFGLLSLYGEETITAARRKLDRKTEIDSGKDTLIRISVEDRDPKRAADLANGYVEELQRENARIAVTESSSRRMFFEGELKNEKEALAAAELALKSTQQTTGAVELNAQTEAVMRAIAGIRAEITAREVSLKGLGNGATAENAEVIRGEAELRELRSQLQKLESGVSGKPGDPLMAFSKIPGAGLEYLRRLRELQYHEAVFELLAKQNEAARIDESKASPTIQVVDYAIPPELKSSPIRGLIAGVCGLLACSLAAGWVVMAYVWKQSRV